MHRRFWFSRDTSFLQRWLDDEYERSGGTVDYVGEWHVHPQLETPPSYVDRGALWRIARKPNYVTTEPILLIVEDSPVDRRFRVYGFELNPKKSCQELTITFGLDTHG